MKDHVRDDVREESLDPPLYKGFLLKNVRDERFSSNTIISYTQTMISYKRDEISIHISCLFLKNVVTLPLSHADDAQQGHRMGGMTY